MENSSFFLQFSHLFGSNTSQVYQNGYWAKRGEIFFIKFLEIKSTTTYEIPDLWDPPQDDTLRSFEGSSDLDDDIDSEDDDDDFSPPEGGGGAGASGGVASGTESFHCLLLPLSQLNYLFGD